MDFYYEDRFLIFKLKSKLHEKVILYNRNYRKHIKISHPDVSLKYIREILEDPDYVYKYSRNSKTYYYEKNYDSITYRVVISKYKKHVKCVITCYKVELNEAFTKKHALCVYDKEVYLKEKEIEEEFENNIGYFYELFNIVE
ncbi:hypothetical protein [uncultured Clostridium sp.]|uniref:hypothetical protein n=1 Tax=uncultured Clostridium sp. TaxID=59620 RepID=UPI00258FFE43|nr:hypothetical protein [uncultured Clostridium sp.]